MHAPIVLPIPHDLFSFATETLPRNPSTPFSPTILPPSPKSQSAIYPAYKPTLQAKPFEFVDHHDIPIHVAQNHIFDPLNSPTVKDTDKFVWPRNNTQQTFSKLSPLAATTAFSHPQSNVPSSPQLRMPFLSTRPSLTTFSSPAVKTLSATDGNSSQVAHARSEGLNQAINRALRIPRENGWLCSLLARPQALREQIAHVSPFQHACSALLSLNVDRPVLTASPSYSSYMSTQPADVHSYVSISHLECALIPLLSRDGVTLCVATNSKGDPIPAAFDNKTAELFLLSDSNTAFYITPSTNAASVIILTFQDNAFSSYVCPSNDANPANEQHNHDGNLSKFVRSVSIVDVPDACAMPLPSESNMMNSYIQSGFQANSQISALHSQTHDEPLPLPPLPKGQTLSPKHPLDFTVLARNVAALTTSRTKARVQECPNPSSSHPVWRCTPHFAFSIKVWTQAATVAQWAEKAALQLSSGDSSNVYHSSVGQGEHSAIFDDENMSEGVVSDGESQSHNSHNQSWNHSQSGSGNASSGGRGDDSVRPHGNAKSENGKEIPLASVELRKIRNRESAARSNLRRKLRTEALRCDLTAEKDRMDELRQRQESLLQENAQLKQIITRQGFIPPQ